MQTQNLKHFKNVKIMLVCAFVFYVFLYAYPVFFLHYSFYYQTRTYFKFYNLIHNTPLILSICYIVYAILMIIALQFFSKNLQNTKIFLFAFLYLFFNYILIFFYFIQAFIFSMNTIKAYFLFFKYAPCVILILMVLVYVFLMGEFFKNSTQKKFKILCLFSAIFQILAFVEFFYFGFNQTAYVLNTSSFVSMGFELVALLIFVIACCKFFILKELEQK